MFLLLYLHKFSQFIPLNFVYALHAQGYLNISQLLGTRMYEVALSELWFIKHCAQTLKISVYRSSPRHVYDSDGMGDNWLRVFVSPIILHTCEINVPLSSILLRTIPGLPVSRQRIAPRLDKHAQTTAPLFTPKVPAGFPPHTPRGSAIITVWLMPAKTSFKRR